MAIYVGSVGVVLRLNLGIDLSGGGDAKVRYQTPSGATGTWDATVVDAGAGVIEYTFAAGDLSEEGTWKLNSIWDPAGAELYYGQTAYLHVSALGA